MALGNPDRPTFLSCSAGLFALLADVAHHDAIRRRALVGRSARSAVRHDRVHAHGANPATDRQTGVGGTFGGHGRDGADAPEPSTTREP